MLWIYSTLKLSKMVQFVIKKIDLFVYFFTYFFIADSFPSILNMWLHLCKVISSTSCTISTQMLPKHHFGAFLVTLLIQYLFMIQYLVVCVSLFAHFPSEWHCSLIQSEWMLWSSVWRFHHRRFWGFHRWDCRNLRVEKRPVQHVPNHQEGPGFWSSVGMLHRCMSPLAHIQMLKD